MPIKQYKASNGTWVAYWVPDEVEMDRKRAIEVIECLYPADSDYQPSRETGNRLLEQAKREVNNWRYEPTPVLIRYAQLCIELEREQDRKAQKNYEGGL